MPGFLKTRLSRLPIFWRMQLVFWSAYFVHGCFSRIGYYDHVAMGVGMSLLLEPTEFLLSCGLRLAYRRWHRNPGFNAGVLGVILLMSFAATLLQLAVAKVGAPWIAYWADYHARPSSLITRISYFLFIYVGWSVAYVWLKSVLAAQEARAAAQRAELQMLRLQLNPHFLFNSLNNIATEIPDQPDTALEMTHDLADFLRLTLDQRGDGLIVPLAHEVEIMTSYLKIERQRFGGRLAFVVEVDPAARQVRVPGFLLQPLAENAVKHGLNSAEPPWELNVTITTTGNGAPLLIVVSNTGLLRPDWETKPEDGDGNTGIGVANLRRRLALHYPERHRFTLRQDGPVVLAEISLEGDPCPV